MAWRQFWGGNQRGNVHKTEHSAEPGRVFLDDFHHVNNDDIVSLFELSKSTSKPESYSKYQRLRASIEKQVDENVLRAKRYRADLKHILAFLEHTTAKGHASQVNPNEKMGLWIDAQTHGEKNIIYTIRRDVPGLIADTHSVLMRSYYNGITSAPPTGQPPTTLRTGEMDIGGAAARRSA